MVEVGNLPDGIDDIGGLVHGNNGSSSQSRLCVLAGIEVHEYAIADVLGQDGRR